MSSSGTQTPTQARVLRKDIEGLRAVAVGLVLAYHAGIRVASGGFVGVDVFFVISGFLITGTLLREVQRTGRVSIRRFYARRVRRLLPASALVLIFTGLLVLFALPSVSVREYGFDIAAAAGFFINWRLAARSVDYLSEDLVASPVQHFWSLSVEEQFYVLWPLLIVLVLWQIKRAGWDFRKALLRVLVVVAVGSLGWSVLSTGDPGSIAYFDTTTRVWELALGALLAVGAEWWAVLRLRLRIGMGWVGIAAIGVSGFLFDEGSLWPGYAALLPTLGTFAVIAGGMGGVVGVGRLLSWTPAVWIGGLSYSIYLWHWPLIVVGKSWGYLGQKWGLAIVLFSIFPAWLSQRAVEDPVRYSRSLVGSDARSIALGLGLTTVGVVVGVAIGLSQPGSITQTALEASLEPTSVGAGALRLSPDAAVDERAIAVRPSPELATVDLPAGYKLSCNSSTTSPDVSRCLLGDIQSEYRVAVVGDSKMLQWYSALEAVGQERGWRIELMTKSACSFSDAFTLLEDVVNESCSSWNRSVMALLVEDPVELLISSQRNRLGVSSPSGTFDDRSLEQAVAGLVSRWESVEALGTKVVVVFDNPRPPNAPVYGCVADHKENLSFCEFDRQEASAFSGAPAQLAASQLLPSVGVVDLTDFFCPTDTCPPVIGGVLVYRQGSHISDTYIRSLTPFLFERLRELVP